MKGKPIKVVHIASSSSGNACLVSSGETTVLVDCGVPLKTVRERCVRHGIDYESIGAVLLTHDHGDHIKGLGALLNKTQAVVFANQLTAESASRVCGVDISRFYIFENNQEFEFGEFSILPFSVPHDTPDPVGFLVKSPGTTYFHATDIGTPLASIGDKFSLADIATLESNHDLEMLSKSGRPQSTINRIRGPRGHLSNDDACELVKKYASLRLKRLYLAHLSQDCNDSWCARMQMEKSLSEIGRSDVKLTVLDACCSHAS